MSAASELTINGAPLTTPEPITEIRTAIHGPLEYLEIWLTRQDGKALSSLVNASHAFFVWMTPDCPEGWHSIADREPSAKQRDLGFQLANGQRDIFPDEMCVRRASVPRTFQSVWASGERSSCIKWCCT